MSGDVKITLNDLLINYLFQLLTSNETTIMDSKYFYKELRLRGYNHADMFKSVVDVRGDGTPGKVNLQLFD